MTNFKPHPSPHDFGVLSMEDIPFWLGTLQRVAMDFGEVVMLELGVANGGTTIGTKRHCDQMGWQFEWVGLDMACGRPAFDLGRWGIFLEGDLHTAQAYNRVADTPHAYSFNLLMIDDCHCFEDCRDSFLRYSPLVRKGGYIAFHDTNAAPGWQGYHEQCKPDRFIGVRNALKSLGLMDGSNIDYEFIGEQDRGTTQGFRLYRKLI